MKDKPNMEIDFDNPNDINPNLLKRETSFSILVIDDDKMIQALFKKYLEFWGFETINVYDPFLGVAEAIKRRPAIIILDIFMPELDGEKLLKLLKIIDLTRNIPIIIVSANLDINLLSSTHQNGASGFLSKPFTQSELFAQIKKVISPALFNQMKKDGAIISDIPENG